MNMLAHTESQKNKPTPGCFFRVLPAQILWLKTGKMQAARTAVTRAPCGRQCHDSCQIGRRSTRDAVKSPTTQRFCAMLLVWPTQIEIWFGCKRQASGAGPVVPAPGGTSFHGMYRLSQRRPPKRGRLSGCTDAKRLQATGVAISPRAPSRPVE